MSQTSWAVLPLLIDQAAGPALVAHLVTAFLLGGHAQMLPVLGLLFAMADGIYQSLEALDYGHSEINKNGSPQNQVGAWAFTVLLSYSPLRPTILGVPSGDRPRCPRCPTELTRGTQEPHLSTSTLPGDQSSGEHPSCFSLVSDPGELHWWLRIYSRATGGKGNTLVGYSPGQGRVSGAPGLLGEPLRIPNWSLDTYLDCGFQEKPHAEHRRRFRHNTDSRISDMNGNQGNIDAPFVR